MKTILLLVLMLIGTSAEAGAMPHIIGDTIDGPLTERPASAEIGERIFVARESGHCVLCHRVEGLDAPFQGDIGPQLSDVGDRLSPGQLRLRIVDSSILNAQTIMPPYYRRENLHRVANAYEGETVLTAIQIEHLVAYLSQRRSGGP